MPLPCNLSNFNYSLTGNASNILLKPVHHWLLFPLFLLFFCNTVDECMEFNLFIVHWFRNITLYKANYNTNTVWPSLNISLRLGATTAERAKVLKQWLDEVAIMQGVPSECMPRADDGTRLFGRFNNMKGFECGRFKSFLTSRRCQPHYSEVLSQNLSWGEWIETVAGGRGNSSTFTLRFAMFY